MREDDYGLIAQHLLVALADDPLFSVSVVRDDLLGTTLLEGSLSDHRKAHLEALYRYVGEKRGREGKERKEEREERKRQANPRCPCRRLSLLRFCCPRRSHRHHS
jgi:hypothetical protein